MAVRDQRRQLADARAMEEEDRRVEMRGNGKHFYGAGATPSMGLSQFRGGAVAKRQVARRNMRRGGRCNKCGCDDSSSDEDMEGGNVLSGILGSVRTGIGALGRLGSRFRPGYVPRPTSSLASQMAGTSTALTTRVAKPALSPSQYANIFRAPGSTFGNRLGSLAANVGAVGTRLGRSVTASRVSAALAAGIPIGMLGAYLADRGNQSGDAGYYDDYTGDVFGGPGGDILNPPTPSGPSGGPSGGPGGPGGPFGPGGEVLPDDILAQMTRAQLASYLQSGNLPGTLARRLASQAKSGSGKRAPAGRGRSARAQIVKQVMKDRGVSLAQASKIVKQEGLY